MTLDEESKVTLLDGLVAMLSKHVTTSDPDIRGRLRRAQRSHLEQMNEAELNDATARLSGYSPMERAVTALLLVITERDANESYADWLWDGLVGCKIPSHVVIKAIYVVPFMLSLEVPVSVSTAAHTLAASPDTESFNHFVGRLAAEHIAGTSHGEHDEHLEWIGAHSNLLLPYSDHLHRIGSIDRSTCDTLIHGASVLSSGAI